MRRGRRDTGSVRAVLRAYVTQDEPSALPAVSRRRTTLLNLFFSYASMGLVLVQGIVLVPLYVAKVPLALYGAWLATGNVLTWLEMVDPGTGDVIRQRVARLYGANDRAALARAIGTGLRLSFVFALLPMLAWPLAPSVARFVNLTGADAASLQTSFRVGLVGVTLSLASYGFSAVSNGLQLAYGSGVAFIAISVLGIVVTIALLVGGAGLVAIPLGLALRGLLMTASFAWIVLRWKRKHLPEALTWDADEARGVLSLSVATFTSRIGTALLDRLDALLTSHVHNNRETLVYTLTGRALDPVRMLTVSLPTALMPGLAHLSGTGEKAKIAETVALLTRVTGTVAAVCAGSVAALDAIFVRVWVGPRMFGGAGLAALLALSVPLSGFSVSLNRVAYALGAIRQASWVALAEAVVKVPLQYVLLRTLGLPGLPLAAAIGSLSVSGWYLPTVVARQVGEAPRVHIARGLRNVARVVGAVVLGRGVHEVLARLPIAWSWASFIVAAAVVGAGFGALGLALDATLREALVARLRARSR